MPWWAIVLIVIGALLVALIVFLLIFGRKMQERQANAEKQMEANKQYVDVLIIDKKKCKLKEAGLPDAVLSQAPAYSKLMKMPVVKVKLPQNRVMTLLADQKIYDILPVKKMCRIAVSGLYITELKNVRGASTPKVVEKKTLRSKLKEKLDKAREGK